MERPSISTGQGDDGFTGTMVGSRERKSSSRMHVLGSLDELNTILGVILADDPSEFLKAPLTRVQRALFTAGSDIATPLRSPIVVPRIAPSLIRELEEWGVEMERALPPLTRFILPGGSHAAALLHQARAVCRRAERLVVEFSSQEETNPQVQIFLNRLSDCLFLAARMANKEANKEDIQI